MGQVFGDILPLALGVAISPVPIIAVILMLFSRKPGPTSAGFLAGWIAGIAIAVTVFVLIAGASEMGSGGQPSTLGSWLKLVLGLLLIALAVKQWRSRPKTGREVALPKWMSAIDSLTAGKAVGLGFLLSAVNPKNLTMCVAAAAIIAAGGLGTADATTVVVIFTVLAACTVAIPVIGYALARESMRAPLDRLKTWLQTNNAAVMAVLLLVIGVVLAGKGIGGLT